MWSSVESSAVVIIKFMKNDPPKMINKFEFYLLFRKIGEWSPNWNPEGINLVSARHKTQEGGQERACWLAILSGKIFNWQ